MSQHPVQKLRHYTEKGEPLRKGDDPRESKVLGTNRKAPQGVKIYFLPHPD